MSDEQAIKERLEEGRDKLGGFGEPVWSQALEALKSLTRRVEEAERRADEAEALHEMAAESVQVWLIEGKISVNDARRALGFGPPPARAAGEPMVERPREERVATRGKD